MEIKSASEKRKEQLLLFSILLSMLIWGMSWTSAKVLSRYGEALSIAYVRFWLVVIVLTPLLYFFKIDYKIDKRGIPYFIGSGLFLGLYSLFFFTGLQHGLPGAGGVLVTTLNPIIAYLIGVIISKKIPKKFELIGLFLGVIAGSILLQIWTVGKDLFSSGNSYFLIAAILWAVMSKISSQAAKYGNPFSYFLWLHATTVFGMSFFVDSGAVKTMLLNADGLFYVNLIYFATFNSTFATCCYLYATTKLGAEKASTFIFLVPAGAIFSSWLFLDEAVKFHTVIGGAIGVLAVFMINGNFKRKAKINLPHHNPDLKG